MQRKNPMGPIEKTHDGPAPSAGPGIGTSMNPLIAKVSKQQGAAARSVNSTSKAQPSRTPITVAKKPKAQIDPMAILAAKRM